MVEKADVGLRCCSSRILWVVEEEEEEGRVGGEVSKYVLHHFALVECHYPNCTHTRQMTLTTALPVRYGEKDKVYLSPWLGHGSTGRLLVMRMCTLVPDGSSGHTIRTEQVPLSRPSSRKEQ